MPTPEENVATFVALLQALPGGETLGQLRQALPCGLSELTTWTSQQPDASVRESMAAIAHELSIAGGLGTISPNALTALSELGTLDPADPRIAGFQAQIEAAWPAQEVIQQAVELFDCATSTLRSLLLAAKTQGAQPNITAISQAVASKVGPPDAVAAALSLPDLLAGLVGYRPGGPAPNLGSVLAVAAVSAPAINGAFHADEQVTADDVVGHFTLPGTDGDCFVQSRLVGTGDPGTVAAGLNGYLYRVDLTAAAVGVGTGVERVVIPTGGVPGVAWPGALDGTAAVTPLFAIATGAIGTRGPSEVRQLGHLTVLTFDPPLPAGQSSYFVGFASRRPALVASLTVYPAGGAGVAVDGRGTLVAS